MILFFRIELPPKPSGPFKLDEKFISEIENGWVKVDQRPKLQLKPIDMSSIDTPLKADGVYPTTKLHLLMQQKSPHRGGSSSIPMNTSPLSNNFRPSTAPSPPQRMPQRYIYIFMSKYKILDVKKILYFLVLQDRSNATLR